MCVYRRELCEERRIGEQSGGVCTTRACNDRVCNDQAVTVPSVTRRRGKENGQIGHSRGLRNGCALQVPQSSANRATDTAIRLSIRRPAPGVPTHGSSSPPASSGPAPPPRPGTRRQHASAHPAPLAPFFAQSEVGAAVLLNDGRAKAGQRTIFQ